MLVPRTLGLIGRSVAGISNIVVKKKFDKKIKDGLKNGSIVEINGKYYDVVNIVEET